jgi:phage terminase large subunit-like protein
MIIRPHAGPQTKFLATAADIAIYGGGAGGGKSRGLLHGAARHYRVPGYNAVIFRKTYPEIMNPGGLWDESLQLYPHLGARPRESDADWLWTEYQSSISFSHMQHESNRLSWSGSAIPYLGYDELQLFTKLVFFFMLSRNRTTCGVRPVVRGTCNPDPFSWLAEFIDWWIGEDGFPIPERDGVLRYFVRDGDEIVWKDHASDFPKHETPKSVTFIKSLLKDNPTLMEKDPGYLANLRALPLYERELLLNGNWKVRPGRGMRFRRDWFQIVDKLPDLKNVSRYWDRAGTEPGPQTPDPDETAGVKGGEGPGSILYITDVRHFKKTAALVEGEIAATAKLDGCNRGDCTLWLEQDPAQAGQVERHHLSVGLQQFAPRFCRPTGNRYVRSGPASAAAEVGHIKLLRGPWNEAFLRQVDAFIDERVVKAPAGYHDDITTAFIGWYERTMLSSNATGPRIY